MTRSTDPLTLVYACSGCSSAAQLANHLAVRLDREGKAEMSCIAGIGGHVPHLLRTLHDAAAQSRPIMAIDGCPLSCVRATLSQHGITPTVHIQLASHGVSKKQHADFDDKQAQALLPELRQQIEAMNALHASPHHSHSPGGCGGTGVCRCSGQA
jgi:uncharacterized metal-binding protein